MRVGGEERGEGGGRFAGGAGGGGRWWGYCRRGRGRRGRRDDGGHSPCAGCARDCREALAQSLVPPRWVLVPYRFSGGFRPKSPVSAFWEVGAWESTGQRYRCAQLLLNEQEP